MSQRSTNPPHFWSADGLLSALFLAYLRNTPQHRGKGLNFKIAARLFPQGVPLRDERGVRLQVDPLDFIGRAICLSGGWEPLSLALAHELMRSGGLFLDVGAHFGIYTCSLAKIPGVECIAVEANAASFVKLQQNLLKNVDVSVKSVNVALGPDRTIGIIENISPGNIGYTRVTEIPIVFANNVHLVAMMSLDELLSELSIQTIKLLKIDVEGQELGVLRGLDLTSCRAPENIIMEDFVKDGGGAPIRKILLNALIY